MSDGKTLPTNVVPFVRRNGTPQALGIFRAVSCRDHQSRLRDGQPYFAINHLSSKSGESVAEVMFLEEGAEHWLLCDPTRDLTPNG